MGRVGEGMVDMDRSEALAALDDIAQTLLDLGTIAESCWSPASRRWVTSDDELFDLTACLADCLSKNNYDRLLQWVEFNLDDGPMRRLRVKQVIENAGNNLLKVEHANPIRWMNGGQNQAAAAAARELQLASGHIDALIEFIGGVVPDTHGGRLTESQQRILDTIDKHGHVESINDLLGKLDGDGVLIGESTVRGSMGPLKDKGLLVPWRGKNGYQRPKQSR